eukprot:UN02053
MLLSIHVLGCLWFFVGDTEHEDGKASWFDNVDDLDPDDVWGAYFTAVYFTFVTLSTVGYGDIHPVNNTERGICLIFLLLGTAAFAFMVGMFTTVLVEGLNSQRIASRNMRLFWRFIGHYNTNKKDSIPKYVYKPISKTFGGQWKFDTSGVFEESRF